MNNNTSLAITPNITGLGSGSYNHSGKRPPPPHGGNSFFKKYFPSTPTGWAGLGFKITLFAGGCLVITSYLTPAGECAESETCGKWLTDSIAYLINLIAQNSDPALAEKISASIFAAGGLGYAAANGKFAFDSIDAFLEYMEKQFSLFHKIGKGTFVILFAISQLGSNLAMTLTTTKSLINILLSLLGAAAGATYGAVNLTQKQITKLILMLNHWRMAVLSPILNLNYDRAAYLLLCEKQKIFNRHLNHIEKEFIANIRNSQKNRGANQFQYSVPILLATSLSDEILPEETWRQSLPHHVAIVGGTGLASYMMTPMWTATAKVFTHYGVPEIAAYLLAGVFNISQSYGGLKFLIHFVGSALGILADLLNGRPIQSADFQLNRTKTLLALIVTFGLSVLSYCLVNQTSEKVFAEDDPLRDEERIGGDTAIDIYHWVAYYFFYRILNSLNPWNSEKEKQTYKILKEIDDLREMNTNEFEAYLEKNDDVIKIINEALSEKAEALPKAPSWCGLFYRPTTDETKNKLMAPSANQKPAHVTSKNFF